MGGQECQGPGEEAAPDGPEQTVGSSEKAAESKLRKLWYAFLGEEAAPVGPEQMVGLCKAARDEGSPMGGTASFQTLKS